MSNENNPRLLVYSEAENNIAQHAKEMAFFRILKLEGALEEAKHTYDAALKKHISTLWGYQERQNLARTAYKG